MIGKVKVKTQVYMYLDHNHNKNNHSTTVHLLNLKLIMENMDNKWISILEKKIQTFREN
jgi:hypothetical protein